jgi:catechol 2,3-dioxygenase-like lactoylglutathione lyase family enzyme
MADREAVGDLHLGTVVINVQDMTRAVAFWSAVLGYVPRERNWDPQFMMLADPAGRGLPVSCQLSETARRRSRSGCTLTCTPPSRTGTSGG